MYWLRDMMIDIYILNTQLTHSNYTNLFYTLCNNMSEQLVCTVYFTLTILMENNNLIKHVTAAAVQT